MNFWSSSWDLKNSNNDVLKIVWNGRFFFSFYLFKQAFFRCCIGVAKSFRTCSNSSVSPPLKILNLMPLTRQKVDLFCLGVEQLPRHYRLQFHPHRHPGHAPPTRLNCNPAAGKFLWKFPDQKCNDTTRRAKLKNSTFRIKRPGGGLGFMRNDCAGNSPSPLALRNIPLMRFGDKTEKQRRSNIKEFMHSRRNDRLLWATLHLS